MANELHRTEYIDTKEGLILIACVGISDDDYHRICDEMHKRVGYGILRVDSMEALENNSYGQAEVILLPEKIEIDSIPNWDTQIITVSDNVSIDGNSLSISNDVMPDNKSGQTYLSNTVDFISEQALIIRQKKLFAKMEKKLESILGITGDFNKDALLALFREKDETTLGHVQSVMSLASEMSYGIQQLGFDFSERDIETLREVALIHDVGKLYTPDQLIKNSDTFTGKEYGQMKRHVELNFSFAVSERMEELISLAEKHHYRYGGAGYENQSLTEEEIPLIVRMMINMDAFDAITDPKRAYQKQSKNEVSALEIAIDTMYHNSQTPNAPTHTLQFDEKCSYALLLGFKNSFEHNNEFRNFWLARDKQYFDERRTYLESQGQSINLPPTDPVSRYEAIMTKLNDTLDKFNIQSNSINI